jgi:beta-galactosidase beta subunit
MPGIKTFTQNDGTSFQAELKGDEYLHWIQTNSGDILVYDKTKKNYNYATVKENNGTLKLAPSNLKFNPNTKYAPSISTQTPKIDKSVLREIWLQNKKLKRFH